MTLTEIIGMVSQSMNCPEDPARNAFLNLFSAAHGMTSLLANNAMEYDEQSAIHLLENAYSNIAGGTDHD